MRNLILQECQAQSLVPFLTPGTENFSDVVWKSPDAVHALLPPCLVYKKNCSGKLIQILHIDYKKTKRCLDHGIYSCKSQLEFEDACTFLRNATEKIPLPKNVQKWMFFVKVAMKHKAMTKFLGSFSRSVFNTQYYLNNTKKSDDETNSKTYELKKCTYRIYILLHWTLRLNRSITLTNETVRIS